MARSRRTTLGALAGLVVTAGGCGVLTGASDLTIDRSGELHEGGARNDASAPTGTSDATVGVPPDAASSRLREVTFESGLLVGKDGADTVTGMAFPFNAQPIRGVWSMVVTDGKQFVDIAVPAPNEVYVTFLFGIATFPTGEIEGTIASFAFDAGGDPVTFRISEHAGSAVALGGLHVGIQSMLQVGTVYRAGVHIRTDAQGTLVEGNVATADGAFDPKNQARVSTRTLGAVSRIGLGAVGPESLTAAFDQLLVDTSALPPP